ncbi:MAG: ferritin family protein [Deltaproteobacteria bacterium]|nr:ferritin family protein [Deltaproteobacteria bacterium]MBW1816158.1 ferritin family protein [Deltaproteobacteria bacterium]MBW2283097.1 ferritin family protein [Deltaproteobacteria bacterium]
MQFDSFKSIMEYAIQKEIDAAEFYEEVSEKEKFSGAKETFKSFAAEERKHEELLRGFTAENMEHYKVEKVPDLKRSDYLVDLEYTPGMSYADILRLAMKREEKAHSFYSDFAAAAAEPAHKKLFEVLAQEEAKHKLKLETFLDDYLAEMGD